MLQPSHWLLLKEATLSSKGVWVHHHVSPPFLPGEINFETSLLASMDKKHLKIGYTLKGKNLLLEEKILFF